MTATHTILDTARAAGNYTKLLAAVKAADLDSTLNGSGPFTVFAPNDAAFARLPAGALDGLLKSENKAQLAAVLTLHVVQGALTASDLTGKTSSPASVNGEKLHVDGMQAVTVNGAKVETPDIACSNGIIHSIDTVLLPNQNARLRPAA